MFGDDEFGEVLFGSGRITIIETMVAACVNSSSASAGLVELVKSALSARNAALAVISGKSTVYSRYTAIGSSIAYSSLISVLYAYVYALQAKAYGVAVYQKALAFACSGISTSDAIVGFTKRVTASAFMLSSNISSTVFKLFSIAAANAISKTVSSVAALKANTFACYGTVKTNAVVGYTKAITAAWAALSAARASVAAQTFAVLYASFVNRARATAITSKAVTFSAASLFASKFTAAAKSVILYRANALSKALASGSLIDKGASGQIESFVVTIGGVVKAAVSQGIEFIKKPTLQRVSTSSGDMNKIFVGVINNDKISEEVGKRY